MAGRKPGQLTGQIEALQAEVITYLAKGHSVREAMAKVDRAEATYEQWRKRYPDFANNVDRLRARMSQQPGERPQVGDFGTWRKTYLNRTTYRHQWQWVDMLEGREPRDLSEPQTYLTGRATRLMVNTPPYHCLVPSTPILTECGWKTVAEITTADRLCDRDGYFSDVMDVWDSETEVPVFDVEFSSGDVLRTDASHQWEVLRSVNHAPQAKTTAEIMADLKSPSGQNKWRVAVAKPIQFPHADLPFDPYLLGYWLGDGDSCDSSFAVQDSDKAHLVAEIERAGYGHHSWPMAGGWTVRIYGGRKDLKAAGFPMARETKRIPVAYMTASVEQRMALLQGLMDSDGTILVKDGRAKFTQKNSVLAQDFYRLVSSLGFVPSLKRYSHQDINEIAFKPQDEPVFRLARKAERQFRTTKNCRTNYRVIRDVRPAGVERVRCLTTMAPNNLYLAGDGLIETHNAKSTTITMDYVAYRICADPNVRIIIVSESRDMAQKFLHGIKDRLTNPRYSKMHDDFGPVGGFKIGSSQWAADKIYVGNRDTSEKDPTVEVLGVGSQIYGARADLIILDDVVSLKTGRTAGQRDKIVAWIDQEVSSRLGPTGKLLLVGTRVSPNDVYRHLLTRKPGVWTYLGQPAVEDFADDADDWVTLWPRGNDEAGDEVPMWDGPALSTRRDEIDTSTWSLVYMQQQVSEDAVFPEEAVRKCCYLGNAGPLQEGGVRKNGVHGCYVVIGMDPATPAGYTAMVVLAVDKQTKIRYVLEVVNAKMTPYTMRQKIKELTMRFRPNEWRIEKNGLNQMVSQDNEIRTFLHGMNCRVVEHQTQGNKWDADFGVASLSPLFLGALEVPPRPLILIPNNNTHKGINALMDQLITWSPETPGKTDCVMALWFADLGARVVLEQGSQHSFAKNRWVSDGQASRRRVVNLADYLDQRDTA